MPRLRKIDFENFSSEEAQRVIKDLLLRYPRGPLQRQKKEDYQGKDSYYTSDITLKTSETKDKSYTFATDFGYTDEQAYKTVVAMFDGQTPKQWDFSGCMWRMFPEFSRPKMTRAQKRIIGRLWRSYELFVSNLDVTKLYTFEAATPVAWASQFCENPGSYEERRIKRDHSVTARFTVAASSETEAESACKMMFGHTVGSDGFYCRSTLNWKESDDCDAVVHNNKSVEDLNRRIENAKRTQLMMAAKIEEMEAMKEALEMYNINVFG